MLSVGQNLVVHHAKASVLARSTLPRLQHVQVDLLLWVVESLADALAAGFTAQQQQQHFIHSCTA